VTNALVGTSSSQAQHDHVRVATFFGGCDCLDPNERSLAHAAGRWLGDHGFLVRQGGYDGLMEDMARGATEKGGSVTAVTLVEQEWGDVNEYVDEVVRLPDFGSRLSYFLSDTQVVIGMGGGIGALHELACAIWFASNVRSVPVVVLGGKGKRLLDFLLSDRWVYESPTRPLDFLRVAESIDQLEAGLAEAGLTAHDQHD